MTIENIWQWTQVNQNDGSDWLAVFQIYATLEKNKIEQKYI